MITRTIDARLAFADERLDVKYYVAAGVRAHEHVTLLSAAGVPMARLGDLAGVTDAPRFKRAYAAPEESSVPYLRPYDIFDYLPVASDHLSVARNRGIDGLRVRRGTILQTCSGRNLGPSAYVDAHLERFVLSHDLVRIWVDDDQLSYYLFTFLNTPTGQALLRRGKSGSVIDHLTAHDVASVQVPLLDQDHQQRIADLMATAIRLREQARSALDAVHTQFQLLHPPPTRSQPRKHGWRIDTATVGQRLDVAYHDPLVATARQQMVDAGGIECGELAVPTLPVRYKRYYVELGYGRPILSGRQLLQATPVNLRYVSDRSFKNPSDYVVRAGMTIFGAVGRSEKRIGHPALITRDRDGWLASNDVMRLAPRTGVDLGWLYLAIASKQVQAQIKALVFGSVVDHMLPEDIARIILPPIEPSLAAAARQVWETFARAGQAHRHAIDEFQRHLDQLVSPALPVA